MYHITGFSSSRRLQHVPLQDFLISTKLSFIFFKLEKKNSKNETSLFLRLHQLLSYTPELNMGSITELEFISNFQAIQVDYVGRRGQWFTTNK